MTNPKLWLTGAIIIYALVAVVLYSVGKRTAFDTNKDDEANALLGLSICWALALPVAIIIIVYMVIDNAVGRLLLAYNKKELSSNNTEKNNLPKTYKHHSWKD